ncbi:MAG: M16 family metallopeptidase [Pyrinomonadaceae bacterium]
MNEDIRETRLDNGLVVLTDRMKSVRSATLGFFFRAGARHEPAELNGITHFIEHCVFKGSSNRTALEIAAEQDRLGGNLDAFTTHEETGFVIKVVDDQFERAFSLVADLVLHPRFDEADLANERRVIIEEIKMNEDSPEEVLGDLFQHEFFPGHPLGLPITGTPESVMSFTDLRVRDYHRAAFSAANLVIVAAGNIEHEMLLELVRSNGALLTDTAASRSADAAAAPKTAAPMVVRTRTDLEQAHLILAVPIVDARDDRRYAADLLAGVLGGGTSSRLWQSVREEQGLAYSVGASTAMFLDTGFMAVSAATSPAQLGAVADLVVAEMSSIVNGGVTESELTLMKDQSRASLLLSLEDSADRAASLAHCELVHGRQISTEETLANLDAVTADDVRAVADEFFQTDRIAMAAVGDLDPERFSLERLLIPSP